MFQVHLERTMVAHFVSHPFLKASCGLARLVPVVAARCGFDGFGGAAGLALMVVYALLARRWCSVCEIMAQPCSGLVLIFIRSRVSGVVILLNGSPRSHMAPLLHWVLLGGDQTANIQGSP